MLLYITDMILYVLTRGWVTTRVTLTQALFPGGRDNNIGLVVRVQTDAALHMVEEHVITISKYESEQKKTNTKGHQ